MMPLPIKLKAQCGDYQKPIYAFRQGRDTKTEPAFSLDTVFVRIKPMP